MNIRILGAHNCESESTKFVSIIIDKAIAIDAGGLTSTLSFAAQQELLALLLTHGHYDHIKDFPALAMNLFLHNKTIDLYAARPVYDMLSSHLADDYIYPDFFTRPPEVPTVRFRSIQSGDKWQIKDYSVQAVEVNHSLPATGYQVTSQGKSVFFTGDTGAGLSQCWTQISPQLLLIEVTAPDRFHVQMAEAKHLTPNLLQQELSAFRQLKGYLPQVVTVHMNPEYEPELHDELARVAEKLECSIRMAYEGMVVQL